VNPHGLEPYQTTGFENILKAIPFKLIFNYIFHSSKRVISLGGGLSTILRKNICDHSKIIEISNAVNCQEVVLNLEKKSNVCNVLFVGRFASNKGINILAEAIQQLNSEGLTGHFKFILAGTGPLYDKFLFLESFGNVELLGFVNDNDLIKLYQDADLFVLPTLFEGMPTVVLEAMSFGLPIIVTDVGATKIIVDDSNGKIINAGSVEELVNGLIWFSKLSIDERNKLSYSSMDKIRNRFNWQVVADEHKCLFRELCEY
jgi:glycosyltransferase involved in cell wall biosynthesis